MSVETLGQAFLYALTLLVMLFSLVGLVLPIYPGLVVIWLAALAYGLLFRLFDGTGILIFSLMTLLMLLGGVIDNIIIASKTRQGGASWLSLILAFLAAVIVSLLFTPLVGIVAAPAVLFVSEYFRLKRDAAQAWQRVKEMIIGWGLAQGARVLIGVVMVALWLLWAR